MDKVDRVFRASKVAGAWIGPSWARFWPPLGLPAIFGQFPEFFKIRKKLGHFDLEPDFNNFPEIPSSGNLTTQITVWVNTIVFTGLLFRKNRPGPSYSSGPTKAQIGTFQTFQTVQTVPAIFFRSPFFGCTTLPYPTPPST